MIEAMKVYPDLLNMNNLQPFLSSFFKQLL